MLAILMFMQIVPFGPVFPDQAGVPGK